MYDITVGYYGENIRMTLASHSQLSAMVPIDNRVTTPCQEKKVPLYFLP